MKRSDTFQTPTRQPLLDHPQAKLQEDKISGPLSWLNPTRARFALLANGEHVPAPVNGSSNGQSSEIPPPSDGKAQVEWRSRDNRKGRHVLVIPKTATKEEYPAVTAGWKSVLKGIARMFTVFAWWDVSWWIGVLFSVGSAIFIACGFFYWLPLAAPGSTFKGEASVAGGATAFVGATLFQIGAVLLIVEAVNENQTGCFGWALEKAFSNDSEEDSPKRTKSFRPEAGDCCHHHTTGVHKRSALHMQHPDTGRKWEWWPTWAELRDHYFHEIGFLASFILAIGATIFYVSGILSLPGVYSHLSQGVLWGVYWLTYIVGGVLFVISSALYMLETQPHWYQPAPKLLGWWIGVFNMIGSVGWTLSAAFGYCSAHWCEYQSDLTLIWASIGFTIGSLLLWYESLDKYPVERASK